MATAAKFNVALRRARELKGLDEIAACSMFGLSVHEWADLENREDEWSAVTPAYVVRCIVSFFKIDWAAFYNWPTGTIRVPGPRDQDLAAFIRQIREKKELSRDAFAGRVGFHGAFADVIEAHAEGLLLWPLEPAMLLAKTFDIDGMSLAKRLLVPLHEALRGP